MNRIQIKNSENIQGKFEELKKIKQHSIITIEEINGIFYAFDGNDFLAQGSTAEELGQLIAQRFSDRYHLSKIEIKFQSNKDQ